MGNFYEYDAQGNLLTVREGARLQSVNSDGTITVSAAQAFRTTFTYDSLGRLSQVIDANNHTTSYSYDAAGNVIQVEDGLQNAQSAEYLTRGGMVTNLVSRITDAVGRAVSFGYDAARDFVTSISTALGVTQYVYDSRDRQTQITDALGRATQFVYNDKDQLTSTREVGDLATAVDDILSSFSYNALGQLASIAGPIAGAVTQFIYDLAGRIVNLFISESPRTFTTASSIKVLSAGEDSATLSFSAGAGVKTVTVLYKKKTDSSYQSLVIANPVAGDNQITLQGLSGNTAYDFEIQFEDQESDSSYSRKYDFKTKVPELPVILTATVQTVTNNGASVKIDVSKEIASAKLTYRIRGESVTRTLLIQDVRDAVTAGIVFNLEGLRSGLDYDGEITITDRFGVTSQIQQISFKTTGVLLPMDVAIQPTARFGRVVATPTTQVLISVEHDLLSNPFAESYQFDIRDSQGNPVTGITVQTFTNAIFGRCALISGLTANSTYTYTLTITSRGDIAPVTDTFRTASGSDTASPSYFFTEITKKEPTSLVFGLNFSETIKMLEVSLIDQVTQAVKKYHFFNIAGNVAKLFLLNGLEAGRQYTIKLLMVDLSGYYLSATPLSSQGVPYIVTTSTLDQTPPQVTQSTLTGTTPTSATLSVTTNELLKKIRVRYRIIGTNQWIELEIMPTTLAFDITLANLIAGQLYEYQYLLDDNGGNQTVTEWVRI